MPTHSTSPYLSIIVGFVLILMALAGLYVFLEYTSNTLVYFMLVLILAVGAALLTHYFRGKILYKDKNIKAQSDYAVLVIVLFSGIGLYKLNAQSFDFTIYLRDKKEQTVLHSGTLRLLLNNAPVDRRISVEGSVSFPGISSDLRDARVRVELIDNLDWQFTNKSQATSVILKGKDAVLTLEPEQRRCCLTGTVVNQAGQLVEGAEVWIDTLKPIKTTSTGQFIIQLPAEQRMEDIFEIYVRKNNTLQRATVNRIQAPTIVLDNSK